MRASAPQKVVEIPFRHVRVSPINPLNTDGFIIHRSIFAEPELDTLRAEATRIATAIGSSCVRHLRQRSELISALPLDHRLQGLLPPRLSPVRSILFDKTPTENWPVPWHQDLTIAVDHQEDIPGYGPWSIKDKAHHAQAPLALLEHMITIRIHLDPTPADNGALKVIPGSHRSGKIPSSSISDHLHRSSVTCACEPGDVLLMSPLLLHSSPRAITPNRRRILHFEYADLSDLDPKLSWFETKSK